MDNGNGLADSRDLLAIAEELAREQKTLERSPVCGCVWKGSKRVVLCTGCREQFPAYARVWDSVYAR